METIRAWLNGAKNYDEGVKLLLEHSRDAKLKRLYTTEGASDFKRGLLQKELQKLLSGAVVHQQVVQQEQEKVVQLVAKAHNGWPSPMDEVVAALHAQWKPLFSEMNALSSRLYDVAKAGNEAEAGRMAHRILELDDQCDAIYDKRDFYLEHGKLPHEPTPKGIVTDPAKWPLALQNAQRQLRESRLKVKDDPTNEKKAATLKNNEAKVQYYKEKLKLV